MNTFGPATLTFSDVPGPTLGDVLARLREIRRYMHEKFELTDGYVLDLMDQLDELEKRVKSLEEPRTGEWKDDKGSKGECIYLHPCSGFDFQKARAEKAEAELERARAELDDLWEWVEMNRNRQMKETRALSNRHAEKRLRPPTKTRTGEG